MDTATQTQTAPAGQTEQLTGKERIYEIIAQFVMDKTAKKIGKTGGHELFDIVIAGVFEAASMDKTFRFNGGYGSLHVKSYTSGKRRLPSGQVATFGDRTKMRYEEGVTVKNLLTGTKPVVKAAKPPKVAKPAAVKAVKPPKVAKPEAAKVAAGDVNLE